MWCHRKKYADDLDMSANISIFATSPSKKDIVGDVRRMLCYEENHHCY